MILFFDTSALVKFFHIEEGTEIVTELLNNQENEIWVLELVKMEFISALHRRFRNKEINEEMLAEATKGFEEELSRFNIEPLSQIVVKEGEELLKKYGKEYGLRTLDALHIGCYSLISEEDWSFVSTDGNLCAVAEFMGQKVINPLRMRK